MNNSPEHRFQSWACRFLDRIVLPTMWYSSIEHAATDMRNVNRIMALKARGVVAGIPDMFLCQRDTIGRDASVWLELKRGKNKATEQQLVAHVAMQRAGQNVFVCNSMKQVLAALRLSSFKLHGNADNLAEEYEIRASVEKAPTKAPRKRAAKPTAADIGRAHASGIWRRSP